MTLFHPALSHVEVDHRSKTFLSVKRTILINSEYTMLTILSLTSSIDQSSCVCLSRFLIGLYGKEYCSIKINESGRRKQQQNEWKKQPKIWTITIKHSKCLIFWNGQYFWLISCVYFTYYWTLWTLSSRTRTTDDFEILVSWRVQPNHTVARWSS